MNRTTEGRRIGIQWKLTSVLEDLDFADDIALLSSRYVDIEDKTSRLKRWKFNFMRLVLFTYKSLL